MNLWRWLTTSRYTRSLEDRVEELKSTIAERETEILRLNVEVAKHAQAEAGVAKQASIVKRDPSKRHGQPFLGNWLRGKSTIEAATARGAIVTEHEPEPKSLREA